MMFSAKEKKAEGLTMFDDANSVAWSEVSRGGSSGGAAAASSLATTGFTSETQLRCLRVVA